MVGAVVTLNALGLEHAVQQRRSELLADRSLWTDPSKRQAFSVYGFHHQTDDDTVRERFVETMRTLDFRAHVCFSRRTVKGLGDDDLLLVMHYTLVRNLLRRYAGQTVEFVFETKSELDSLYGRLVEHAMESLDKTHTQRASLVLARIGDKPLGGLSVVDYALSITEAHLRRQDGDALKPFQVARFTRIASHLAHLIDFDTAAHKHRLARVL